MFVEKVDVISVLEVPQEPNCCQKLLNDSSIEKHDDHAQVDINSLGLSSIKTCQKKRKKKRARKSRKSSACSIVSLGSIEEGPLSSVLVVHDRSVAEISSNISSKAGDGSSVLAGGEISLRKVSGESANGEPLSGRKKKKKRKKKRKLTACPITTLGSTEEGGSPSVLVVPNGSVGEITLNQSVEVLEPCNSAKLREEVIVGNNTSVVTGGKISQEIAGNGTSVRIGGKISQEMASHVCPNGESEFEKRKEKSKMGNLEENNTRQGGVHRRKRRKSSACLISSLESIEKGAQESSAGSMCVNHLDEAPEPSYSGKMMEVVVERLKTSQEKASGERSYGETASGKERKKSKIENMEESNMGNCVGKDASLVGIPETDLEQGNKDMDHMADVIQNAVLSKEDKASDDVRDSVPSVDDIEVDNVGVQPMLNGVIPSSSELGVMMNSVTLESPQSSGGGAPNENLKKKILVLDVNGLLAAIVPAGTGGYQPHKVLSQKAVFKRPFCDDFLQFCFERFHVGVWSSRNRKNVNSVLDFLMGKSKRNLLFCWDQSHCTNTGYNTVENREKPLLLKELKRLWDKHEPDFPWASGEYNESNTLLLDDSPYKALRNPPHTAIFPHSYCYKDQNDNSLGPGGDLRVYLEGLASADNVQKYVEQNPFGQRPISNRNLSWRFYLKIIGTPSAQGEEDATNDSLDCQQREEDAANNSLLCQQRS